MKPIVYFVLIVLLFSFNNVFSMGDLEENERPKNINQQHHRMSPSGMENPQNSLIFGNYPPPEGSKRLSQNAVEDIILKHVISNNPDNLYIKEVMEFNRNFYIQIGEKNSDFLAFELLIDPFHGYISPEPGPNMMWNTKYGHNNFARWFLKIKSMDLTQEQAIEIANKYLESYMPGSKAENHADKFHGYYTLHVIKNNKTIGMVSVNGYTGEIWFHTWNGELLKKKE